MAPEQDWCLECGIEATARVPRAPSWILPAVIIVAVLAVAAVAVLVVAGALRDDADNAAGPHTRARTPSAAKGKAMGESLKVTAAKANTIGTAATANAQTAAVPLWPRTRTGYTIVVAAPTRRAVAVTRARGLRKLGRDAGILHSDDYDFFGPGLWVVWRGTYSSRAAAERSEIKVQRVIPSAYATFIRRKGT